MLNGLKARGVLGFKNKESDKKNDIGGVISFKNDKRKSTLKFICKSTVFFLIAAISGGTTAAIIVKQKLKDISGLNHSINYYIKENSSNTVIPNNNVNNVINWVSSSVVGIGKSEDAFNDEEASKFNGSGIICDSNGYIVTSYDIVSDVSKIFVKIPGNNRKIYKAEFIGYDKGTNLAVIKIDESSLIAARLADSSLVRTGDYTIAIGNPKGSQFGNYVSLGVISATDKSIDYTNPVSGAKVVYKMLQTDAEITNDNNGGPLCNERGDVIGINTKYSKLFLDGSSFAVPASEITKIINSIKYYDKIARPSLGIVTSSIKKDEDNNVKGLYITGVNPDSFAEESGIKPGDILTEIYGNKIVREEDMSIILERYKIGDMVKVKILRDDQEMQASLLLEEEKQ